MVLPAVKRTTRRGKISIDDIIARNFNLDIKNPYQGETISHDPDELLAQYQTRR